MKTIIRMAACFFAATVLALMLGCKSKPIVSPMPEAPPSVGRSLFVGIWEGTDKNGEIFTFRFTATEWESHVERDGTAWPHYRGTYTYTGSSASLRIVEEANLRTGGWMPDRGNVGQNISARLSGGTLKVVAFTTADFVRKR
jgi:hypothetical protein